VTENKKTDKRLLLKSLREIKVRLVVIEGEVVGGAVIGEDMQDVLRK